MTETTTATEAHTGAKMCQAGSKTERPCWRPATETDLDETEPTLCNQQGGEGEADAGGGVRGP